MLNAQNKIKNTWDFCIFFFKKNQIINGHKILQQ